MGREDTKNENFDVYEDEGDSFDDMDDDEFALMDCAMGRDGHCGHAGTEFCDFECPEMRRRRAADRAWREELYK